MNQGYLIPCAHQKLTQYIHRDGFFLLIWWHNQLYGKSQVRALRTDQKEVYHGAVFSIFSRGEHPQPFTIQKPITKSSLLYYDCAPPNNTLQRCIVI